MYKIIVYTTFNNTHTWIVDTREKAHEYAKRIITEGLYVEGEEEEQFFPTHIIVKVKVVPHV